jgi:hypothetical protein
MNMKEGYWSRASMVQMELVDGVATDGSKGCEDMAARVSHNVCHHATVRETATVEALSVKGVLRGNILYDGF